MQEWQRVAAIVLVSLLAALSVLVVAAVIGFYFLFGEAALTPGWAARELGGRFEFLQPTEMPEFGLIRPSATPAPTDRASPSPIPPEPTASPIPITSTPAPSETPIPPTATPHPTQTAGALATDESGGSIWTRPIDGAQMVFVPAGEFLMGSLDSDPRSDDDEKPQHTVYLDAFWIDKYEVTSAQYLKCVEAGVCAETRCWDESRYDAADQPVGCVTWYDAQTYANWAGGRLPTEAEWEKASRGINGHMYPWGNSEADCRTANHYHCAVGPLPVGSHPAGASPYGAQDMAGNVAEWVADWYAQDTYSRASVRDPQGPTSGDSRVLRGGAAGHYRRYVRCASRSSAEPDYSLRIIGFRVAVSPGPPDS